MLDQVTGNQNQVRPWMHRVDLRYRLRQMTRRIGLAIQQRSPFYNVCISDLNQNGQLMLPLGLNLVLA